MVQDVQTVVAGQRCPTCRGNVVQVWDEVKCAQCGREPYVDHTPVPVIREHHLMGRKWPDEKGWRNH